jgi:hypothetical protein
MTPLSWDLRGDISTGVPERTDGEGWGGTFTAALQLQKREREEPATGAHGAGVPR